MSVDPADLYTTVYCTTLPAACETGTWLATYTVTETCTGNPAEYTAPAMPPGFVVTTVSCGACQPATEIEITCPGAQPTEMGAPTYQVEGNGVTATITATATASPAGAPAMGGGAPAAAPTATAPAAAAGSSAPGSYYAPSGSPGSPGSMGGNYSASPSQMPAAVEAGASPLMRSLATGTALLLIAGHFFLL
ncbi:hypothetical protein GGR56DRAFT_668030 [Xylariaceae sp. FL0804]|nr:hypothetical protein GGR56DRAFT_668030 [Xylariaceae sp. FL0804]